MSTTLDKKEQIKSLKTQIKNAKASEKIKKSEFSAAVRTTNSLKKQLEKIKK